MTQLSPLRFKMILDVLAPRIAELTGITLKEARDAAVLVIAPPDVDEETGFWIRRKKDGTEVGWLDPYVLVPEGSLLGIAPPFTPPARP